MVVIGASKSMKTLPQGIDGLQVESFFRQFGSIDKVAEAFGIPRTLVERTLKERGVCIPCHGG